MTAPRLQLTRRQILAGAAALPLFSIASRPAHAAEFNFKFATGQDPSHPVNKRAQEAIDRIRNATGGRLDIKLFPANQLGSDTDLLSQIRNGGVEFFNQASVVLSTLVPAAGIINTVWDAYWILGNRKAMERLPKDIQDIVRRELEKAATDERADIAALSSSLRTDLASKGVQMVEPDKKAFKDALTKGTFYKDLRAKFGDEAWKLLQDSVGSLG